MCCRPPGAAAGGRGKREGELAGGTPADNTGDAGSLNPRTCELSRGMVGSAGTCQSAAAARRSGPPRRHDDAWNQRNDRKTKTADTRRRVRPAFNMGLRSCGSTVSILLPFSETLRGFSTVKT